MSEEGKGLWEDRDVKFDCSTAELRYHTCEELLDRVEAVEDTKGNSGDRGRLYVTNLRLIWQSNTRPRVNLSVGWNCVTGVSTRTVHSKLRGITEALYLLTKVNNTRFEFIFTNLAAGSPKMVNSVLNVHRAYNATKLYRDLKLRSAIVLNKQLKVLPLETICNKISGVWNLSSDQGNLGTFYITNVRVVWHANINEGFNISLPYIQIAQIRTRDSKFGQALVIETTESSGSYVLGFKVDPSDRLSDILKELRSIYEVHKTKPVIGIDSNLIKTIEKVSSVESNASIETIKLTAEQEAADVVDTSTVEQYDAFTAYLEEDANGEEKDVVYNEELGLAIERIKDGFTLASLWEVIPST